MDPGGTDESACRVVLPDCGFRWVRVRGRALLGSDGRPARVVGAAFDTTDARESQDRVVGILETMPSAFLALDLNRQVTYANAEATALTGRDREELVGMNIRDV